MEVKIEFVASTNAVNDALLVEKLGSVCPYVGDQT